ncbi:MAG: hypothetical protein LBL18_02600, partial [Bacteroidales bacterium]|nr:hypothetical protein [Bacteroidales bacterium]
MLVLFSLAFAAFGSMETILLLGINIIVNYAAAMLLDQIEESKHKARIYVLFIDVTLNIATLFCFKYLAWSLGLLNSWFGINLSAPNLLLPLGISFFTFRSLSYVCDVYFGIGKANRNIIYVALYISCFPQLISGPITRYADFETTAQNKTSLAAFSEGIWLFSVGITKKVIIANNIAPLVDTAFGTLGGSRTVLAAWLGAIGYLIQLYFDFSGYSDMAVGLSKMFGLPCAQNFNYPYCAASIREYWQRWHISLYNWFRVYMFTPLQFSLKRKGYSTVKATVISMFAVWVFTGIWHGAGL